MTRPARKRRIVQRDKAPPEAAEAPPEPATFLREVMALFRRGSPAATFLIDPREKT